MNSTLQDEVASRMRADEVKRKTAENKRISSESGLSRSQYESAISLRQSLVSKGGKEFEANILSVLGPLWPVDVQLQYKPNGRGKHKGDIRFSSPKGEVIISAKVSLRERWKQWIDERAACMKSARDNHGGRYKFLFVGLTADECDTSSAEARMARQDTFVANVRKPETIKALVDLMEGVLL